MSHTLEILAPVGNADMLAAAVFAGADAIYCGLTAFNARRTAGNFTPEELKNAVCFCHARNVRVHVTLNTLLYANELPAFVEAVKAVAEAGADAVIVDDLAAARLVRQIASDLELHGSTQMSVHTPAGALELAKLGYDRVILARELSLPEIKEICAVSPIPCEVFIHGAMCFAMSGQCMMSAFLGGRSGNRGACAGPCRLPFDANPKLPAGQPGKNCHISLKDMDLIPYLPQLAEAGVASVKIEGRLRPAEYCAVSVAACVAARGGKPYDAKLVSDIFSRSGFTDGYFKEKNDGAMFGMRTESDTANSKAAAPKAREIYRRELQKVPVWFTAEFDEEGIKLTAEDEDGNRAIAYSQTAPQPAQRDPMPGMEKALSKTGGTPFVFNAVETEGEPMFLPAGEWNEMRRKTLDKLLQLRSKPVPHAVSDCTLPVYPTHAVGQTPKLAARFETAEQIPAEWAERLAFLVLPISQAAKIPQEWRAKTLLELPRVKYGKNEANTAALLGQYQNAGFAGAIANNIGDFELAKGRTLFGGMGLNCTNPMSAEQYTQLGAKGLLVHPETSVVAMKAIAPAVPTAALVYAHIPVMLTRACPMRNVRDCTHCTGTGSLRDRKGRDFPVRCSAPGMAGVRMVYNPVPLYMGDRLTELPADYAVAAFTLETPARIAAVLELLASGKPFDGEFTRGLYYTNN